MPQRQYSVVSILVGLVALLTVAFFWPSTWANPFLASKPLLDWLILITMFAGILWIIAYVVAKSRDDFRAATWVLGLLLLSINLGGYLAGYLGGRMMGLPEPMRRALTLEVGMQNAGLSAVLAAKTLTHEAAAAAPAMYTFGCLLTGTMLACPWASFAGGPGQDSRDP